MHMQIFGVIGILLSNSVQGFHPIYLNQQYHISRIRVLSAFAASVEIDSSGIGDTELVHLWNDSETGHDNLSSPRDWLEYQEKIQGSAGVYTVMRVDATNQYDSSSSCYRAMHTFWDKEFHLNRLGSSFVHRFDRNVTTEDVAFASVQSNVIIIALIRHLQQILWKTTDIDVDGVKILMLTLLWTPSLDTRLGPIVVKGHICSSNILVQPQLYDPQPIKAVLALPDSRDFAIEDYDEESRPWSLRNLPSRSHNYPRAKVSSWCRIRRPLEKLFKTAGIDEVILVNKCGGINWEILEGLTSNIFVLYGDGTLRTCHTGVLEGYAQSIVQKAAYQCNVTMSHSSITIQDAVDGMWSEVFITSSIRLITPVKEIWIPDYNGFDARQEVSSVPLVSIWKIDESQRPMTRLWKVLYSEILRSRRSILPESSFI